MEAVNAMMWVIRVSFATNAAQMTVVMFLLVSKASDQETSFVYPSWRARHLNQEDRETRLKCMVVIVFEALAAVRVVVVLLATPNVTRAAVQNVVRPQRTDGHAKMNAAPVVAEIPRHTFWELDAACNERSGTAARRPS